MPASLLHFEDCALGRPFHAAEVGLRGESEAHGHADYYEVMAVVDGNGAQLLSSGVQKLRAGDVVLVRSRDEHALRGLGPDGVTFVNIAFPATAWRTFVQLAGVDPADALDRSAEPPHFRLPADQADQVAAIARTALARFRQAPTRLDLIHFLTCLLRLLPVGAPPESGSAAERARPEWLVHTCAAMHREDNLQGGVPRMLALATVSPAHLSRSMRAHYGVTPTAYVQELRLRHAAHLLATTQDAITEIAHRCGFASASYFSRCFQREHRISPRRFRHQALRAFVP